MKCNLLQIMFVWTFILSVCGSAAAAPAASVESQINHLITYVRESNLIFIRNGSENSSAAAAQHIDEKYSHFKADISSVNDFIDKAASKSLLSGQPYLVKLPDGSTKPVADWLREEFLKQGGREG